MLPRRQAVTFDTSVRVKIILALEDYSRSELEASWFDREEYGLMRQEIDWTVQRLESGKAICDDDRRYCPRGLESRTQRGNLLGVNHVHRDAQTSVLLMQKANRQAQHQQEISVEDQQERIALVYGAQSEYCAMKAHVLGLADEEIAQKIHQERSSSSPPPSSSSSRRRGSSCGVGVVAADHKLQRQEESSSSRVCKASKLLSGRRNRMRRFKRVLGRAITVTATSA